MSIPWEAIGLSRFCAVDGEMRVCVEGGEPRPERDCTDTPLVSYADTDGISLGLLARVLLPTLSDHSLSGLCSYFRVTNRKGERIVALLAGLIEEGMTVFPRLLALLSRLLPGPTGDLLSALVPHASTSEERPPAEPTLDQGKESPAPVVTVEDALSPTGPVGQGMAAFEDRPGQLEMARLVEETFSRGGKLLVEAGPGTGKTFAYLVPALIYLRDHPGTRIVVSTRTKQLQEQVYEKDIPFLIPRIAPGVKAALLKGRENYACLRQWERVLPEVMDELDRDLLIPLAYFAGWLFRTETGDIEENRAFLSAPRGWELWPRLADSPHRCSGPICPFYDDCFSFAARRRARAAGLVVVNHSLLLADLAADGGILGPYDYLIVDEAHSLEGTARDAFTVRLSAATLDRFLGEVHRRRGGWTGRVPLPPDDPRISSLRELVGTLRTANLRLFTRLGDLLPSEQRGPTPALDLGTEATRIVNLLARLRAEIEGLGEVLEDDAPDLAREAERLSVGADEIAGVYSTLFSPPQEGYVHWYERRGDGVFLHSTPLAIDRILAEALYPRAKGIVLTSATLTTDSGFSYIRQALGLAAAGERVREAVVASPFSYQEGMRIYLPRFLPPVNGDGEEYAGALSELITALAPLERKVLVLFTSYRLLNAVHARLSGTVLAQGIDGPRGKLLEQFKGTKGGAVLLGTDSFWEGVDLPGEDLEVLVITRLPFPVPTDPVFSALCSRFEAEGHDPFLELSIPQAVLRLRQGVGRLIRTRADRGAVIITDRRILERGYGARFRASLPVEHISPPTLEALVRDLDDWLARGER